MPRKKYTLEQIPQEEKMEETREEKALRQFKSNISDAIESHHDDGYLLKWLTARGFDIKEAEKMFRHSMEFRKTMGLDTLLETYKPPEVLRNYFEGGLCGHDKEGSPIYIQLPGYSDMKGMMYSAKKTDIEKYQLRLCEQVVQYWKTMSEQLGTKIDGLVTIIDFDQVGANLLWRPGLNLKLRLARILQDNYPEMVKKMFIINSACEIAHMSYEYGTLTPRIFPIICKLTGPFINDHVKKKIFVLSSNYKDTLLQHIDEDQLPAFLGGTMTDPDGNPRCATKLCQGGKVPESYYLKDLTLSEHFKSASLKAGGKLRLEYVVEKSEESEIKVLRWEFKTEEYDIGVGLSLKPSGSDITKVLIPTSRVDSHMVPQDGSWECEEYGTYILTFDNTFSWARSKKIDYIVEVFSQGMDDQVINMGQENPL